jgi:hypothetical protein
MMVGKGLVGSKWYLVSLDSVAKRVHWVAGSPER